MGEFLKCGTENITPPAVCLIVQQPKSNKQYYSLAHSSNFSEISNDLIILTFKNKTEKFSVKIIFKNSQQQLSDVPYFSTYYLPFRLDWYLNDLKPSNKKTVKNSPTIRTDDNIFDIRPLFSKSGSFIYDINMQQYLKLNNVKYPSSASVQDFSLTYSSEKGLYLSLTSETGVGIQIHFVCSSKQIHPELKLIVKGTKFIHFNLSSSLPCKTLLQDHMCSIDVSQDIRYSFDELSANSDNYYLSVDGRPGFKYIFNLCRPLLPSFAQPFTGGTIYAVLLNNHDNSVINLATEQFNPVIDSNHHVIVKFNGSDKCDMERYHDLTIELVCSKDNNSITVLPSTDRCSHHILWLNNVSCPYFFKNFDKCEFKESGFPNFDFTPLRKQSEDYSVSTSDGLIIFNLCGSLNTFSQESASALYKYKNGEYIILGRDSVEPEIREGNISIRYKGDPCLNQVSNSQLNIHFVCDRKQKEIRIQLKSQNNCIFNLMFFTSAACGSYYDMNKTPKCPLSNNFDGSYKQMYNLIGNQYEMHAGNEVVYFSLCSYLPESITFFCGLTSSVYWISNGYNVKHRCFNMAQHESLQIIDDKPGLIYLSDDKCYADNKKYYSIIIIFICVNDNEEKETLHKSSDGCNMTITIESKYACPVQEISSPTSHREADDANCQILSPNLPRINLSHLKEHVWVSVAYKINVSICSALVSTSCPSGTGICKDDGIRKSISLGSFSDKLLYKPNLPYLNYTGPGCTVTIVTFPCDHLKNPIRSFKSIDDCTYIVTWPTAASCINQTAVLISNNHEDICLIDELNIFLNVYNVSLSRDSYIIVGVCSTLPAQCLDGSGACLVDKSEITSYTSLGYPVQKVFKDNFNNWVIKYSDGAICNRYGQQYSTIFKIICDINSKQKNFSFSYNETSCQYVIEMRTVEMCSSQVEPHKETNVIYSKLLSSLPPCSHHLPLQCLIHNLHDSKPLSVSDTSRNHKYLVDFNGENNDNSNGVSICSTQSDQCLPYANFYNLSYISANETFKFQFKGVNRLNQCTGFSGVEIFMKCKEELNHKIVTSFNLSPYLLWENDCTIGIEWHTDLACINLPHDAPASSRQNLNWTMISVTLSVFLPCIMFVLLFRKKMMQILCRICSRRHRSSLSAIHSRLSMSTLSDNETTLFISHRTSC